VFHQRAAHPSERRTFPTKTPARQQYKMPQQQQQATRPYTEADVHLAISDIQTQQIKSAQLAKKVYKVPQTTIQR
jgi:hypothetical protein